MNCIVLYKKLCYDSNKNNINKVTYCYCLDAAIMCGTYSMDVLMDIFR